MTELPRGWERTTVSDIMTVTYGKALDKALRTTDGRYSYVGSGGEIAKTDAILTATNTIVVGRKGTAGSVQRYVHGCWPSDTTFYLEVPGGLDGALVEHQLRAAQLGQHDRSTALPGLGRPDLEATPLVIAPQAEQERIVVAIEEAFSNLEAGEAGLRTVRQLLKRMRDVILAAAVTGRLVSQDPTDTPATKLLADLGIEPISPVDAPALPDAWAWASLGSISDSVRNGIFVSRPPEVPPGIPILRIGAVRRLELDLSDIRYAQLDIADPAVSRASLAHGDLLFTRYNGNPEFVGACAVVPMTKGPVLHPDKLIRVVVRMEVADSTYVAIAVSAGTSRSFIEGVTKTTAGQAGISGGDLKLVPVPVAPLPEQRRIVVEVDRQLSFLDACERAVDAGLVRSAALRRSILKAAFEGGLVEQDPTDEPASVLLERIRAERAAAPKTRTRRATAKS